MRSLSADDQLANDDRFAQSRLNSVNLQISAELAGIDSHAKLADSYLEPINQNPKLRKKVVEPATEKLDQIRSLVKEVKAIIDAGRTDTHYHGY